MCFRTHRTQKIYSPKQFFFSLTMKYRGLDLEFFRRSEKKKLKKILCLKCVSGPIEPKKYIHQNKIFFSLTMKKQGCLDVSAEKKKLKKILCLKCVSEPIEPKKYIHQNKKKISLTMKNIGGWTQNFFDVPKKKN